MLSAWDRRLKEWEAAGLVDSGLAERIRQFEARRDGAGGRHWLALLAWVFGGILLCAGMLLFVAANWDVLSPFSRFTLVVLMILVLHLAAALLRERYEILGQVLHGAGTVALGAGIFLAGQIFNLQEHWPGGVMLWAAGAWLAWLLSGDRIQAVFAGLLTPAWLAGEWSVATAGTAHNQQLLAEGLWLLAFTYLGARTLTRDGPVRHDFGLMGCLALIPLTFWVTFSRETWWQVDELPIRSGLVLAGWVVAFGGPFVLGFLWRGRGGWVVLVAAVWVRLLSAVSERHLREADFSWRAVSVYILCAAACALIAWWGVVEARRERINLAVAGFGLTVISFYFHNVMDKLGRSLSLMSLGLLFLIGGYLLARARRRLLESLAEETR